MDYNSYRRKTAQIRVGNIKIGGDAPVSVQSMTNTDTHDIEATWRQVSALAAAGCDIVRITAPDVESADSFRALKARGVRGPLVADIHFDYKIALAVAPFVDKIRINPGNIGGKEKIREVVKACREYSLPIRIGVNSGSLEKNILAKHGAPTPEALVESALYHASLLEELDFHDIAISVKASSTVNMIAANRALAERCSYPLHLGVTEAGFGTSAIVKSSIGIGTLLSEGIGDTIRVSLTDDPLSEIEAAREILRATGLYQGGMNIVSCPTCGRTKIDLIALASDFERRARAEGLHRESITVALMGCAVNGPGEAREADVGIAGGIGEGLLFRRGEIIAKVPEDKLIDRLIEEIKTMKGKD